MSNNQTLSDALRKVSIHDEEDRVDEKIENERGRVPRDPVKMNKTLKYEYIIKHEPWDALPSTYFPKPKYNHRPYLFVFGFGFRWLELEEFAIKNGLCPAPVDGNSWFDGAAHLMLTARREFDVCLDIASPYSHEADVVLKLYDNYYGKLPYPGRETILKAIDRLRDILEASGNYTYPKWYIDESELGSSEYGVPIDFTQYIPPVPAATAA